MGGANGHWRCGQCADRVGDAEDGGTSAHGLQQGLDVTR
jgi:hypothetical protein